MSEELLIARIPDPDSRLRYLLRLLLGDGMVFRTSDTWPRTTALFSSFGNGTLRFALGELAALPPAALVVEDRNSLLFKLDRIPPARADRGRRGRHPGRHDVGHAHHRRGAGVGARCRDRGSGSRQATA